MLILGRVPMSVLRVQGQVNAECEEARRDSSQHLPSMQVLPEEV